jgi:hypothetical protein
MAGGHLLSFGVLAEELSGAEATRRVLLTSGALVLLGLALLIATVWWWRSTRPEHPVLAPLEVMGDRRWSKADADERRRLMDESRAAAKQRAAAAASAAPAASSAAAAAAPVGATPVAGAAPGVVGGAISSDVARRADGVRTEPERVDLSVLVRSVPVPDDLAEMDVLLGLAPAPAVAAVPALPPRVDAARPVDEPAVRVERVIPVEARRAREPRNDGTSDAAANAASADDVAAPSDGEDRSTIDPLLQRTRD